MTFARGWFPRREESAEIYGVRSAERVGVSFICSVIKIKYNNIEIQLLNNSINYK